MTQAAALAIESGPVHLLRCYACRRPLAEPTLCPTCARVTCSVCLILGGCKADDCPRPALPKAVPLECPHGHPWTPENRVHLPRGRTACRPCRNRVQRAARVGRG